MTMTREEFIGDNAKLCDCIHALLALDAANALAPHGIGSHARVLLSAAASRIAALSQPERPPVDYNALALELLLRMGRGREPNDRTRASLTAALREVLP